MFSVRDVLNAVILILIALSTGAVWLLADTYNRRNTSQLAARIQRELARRINGRISDVLATPHSLNAMGECIVGGEQLNLSDAESVNQVFHGVLPANPHINALFFGGADGSMWGARWSPDGLGRDVMLAGSETGGALNYYRADARGGPGDLVESAPDYDPRQRAWYTSAVAHGDSIWSPIYVDFATHALVMTAARPVYGADGTLKGVMGCGIAFTQIDQFLQALDIGESGIAYLMEHDGTLISTSAPVAGGVNAAPPVRIRAEDSTDSMIADSAAQLLALHENLENGANIDTERFTLASGPAYGSTFRIADSHGLNWVGVVVVPESAYTAPIQDRNRVASVLFVFILIAALSTGLLSARALTRPLTQLSVAAREITMDVWDAPLEVQRQDEIGDVARAFERMRDQLRGRIEELRAARNALSDREEHYARALEAARVVAWSWSLADNQIRWNEHRKPMLGSEPGEHWVDVRDFMRRIHPEDRRDVARAANAAIAGVHDYDIEYRIQCADGGVQWVASRGQLLRAPDGTPTGITGVLLDISDRKRLEHQLLEAQKMEAIGRLAGGVAHDFNNLLQAILGFADMARETAGPDSPVLPELDEVIRAAERARDLVSQLLAYSRRQLLKLGPVALDETVTAMGNMIARLIDGTITLQIETPPGRAMIRADRTQVEQVLVNLCLNGRDAMPSGGTLSIAVTPITVTPADCTEMPSAKPGEYHRLRVRDTGAGMDPQVLSCMFEPFYTTKAVGKGTGLGLATVYGIVQQHRGFIHAASAPGGGTTIDVYFPALDTAPVSEPVEEKPVVATGSGTILIAEDNDAVRQLARRVLERAGYTVVDAADGDAAIAAFDRHRAAIDAAFLDVVMPGKNGRMVLEYLREHAPDLPVMFASGYAEGEVHTNFVLEEGLVLIQKPYNSKKLLAALQALLRANNNGGR